MWRSVAPGVTLLSLDADATTRDLVRSGIPFRDLEVTGACLEDAFVALTERKRAPMAGVTAVSALFAFVRFELVRLLRSWKFLAITVGFPVIFYMLFLGERRSGEIIDGTVPWHVYLMVSMCTFGALVAALNAGGSRLATERSTGWARQLRITPMPAWSYVATKVTASMLVVLPVLVLVELVGFTVRRGATRGRPVARADRLALARRRSPSPCWASSWGSWSTPRPPIRS